MNETRAYYPAQRCRRHCHYRPGESRCEWCGNPIETPLIPEVPDPNTVVGKVRELVQALDVDYRRHRRDMADDRQTIALRRDDGRLSAAEEREVAYSRSEQAARLTGQSLDAAILLLYQLTGEDLRPQSPTRQEAK